MKQYLCASSLFLVLSQGSSDIVSGNAVTSCQGATDISFAFGIILRSIPVINWFNVLPIIIKKIVKNINSPLNAKNQSDIINHRNRIKRTQKKINAKMREVKLNIFFLTWLLDIRSRRRDNVRYV